MFRFFSVRRAAFAITSLAALFGLSALLLATLSFTLNEGSEAEATSMTLNAAFRMRGPDNCNTVANATQADTETTPFTVDPDGAGPIPGIPITNVSADMLGDACDPSPVGTIGDQDGDAIVNSVDNCPVVSNLTQIDADRDGAGDVCDVGIIGCALNDSTHFCADIDGDTVPNAYLAFGGATASDTANTNATFEIPITSANFGRVLNLSSPDFDIEPAGPVAIGAVVGLVEATATLGVAGGACSTPFPPFFTFFKQYSFASLANSVGDFNIVDGFFDYSNDEVTGEAALRTAGGDTSAGSDVDSSLTVYVENLVSGKMDTALPATIGAEDVGPYAGVTLIAGMADINGAGGITAADDGRIRNLGDNITEPLAPGSTNALSPLAVDDNSDGILNNTDLYPRYLLTQFDINNVNPDGDRWADGQPKLGEDPLDTFDNDRDGLVDEDPSIAPTYRYGGFFQLSTAPPTDVMLFGVYFSGLTLETTFSTTPSDPNFFDLGQVSTNYGTTAITVLQDGTVPVSPSAVSDFCSPLTTKATLLGLSQDNVNVGGPTLGGVARVQNPISGEGLWGTNTHIAFWAAASQRDSGDDDLAVGQGDDFENAFDSCHLIDNNLDTVADGNNTDNTHASSGADLDGLDPACDPNSTPGPGSVPNQDGDLGLFPPNDAWGNALDNCPLQVNQLQFETEVVTARGVAAPEGGSLTDGFGDACETTFVPGNAEDGAAAGTCNDGTAGTPIDNGADGFSNREDSDCYTTRDVMNAAGAAVADGIADHIQANGHYHAVVTLGAFCIGTNAADGAVLSVVANLDDDADGWCDTMEGGLSGIATAHPEISLIRLVSWAAGADGGVRDECNNGVDNDGDTVADDPGDGGTGLNTAPVDGCSAAYLVDPDANLDSPEDAISNYADVDGDGDATILTKAGTAGNNAQEFYSGNNPFDGCPNDTTVNNEDDNKQSSDFNDDRSISALDFAPWKAFFPTAVVNPGSPNSRHSDLNGDNAVSALDFSLWKAFFPAASYCS